MALCCTSCVSFKPERETLAEDFTPAEFSKNTGVADQQTQWWQAFESKTLNCLMEEAFLDNLTLEQAAARLEQAEASVRKSGAAGKVQLNGQAESSSRYTSNENGSYTDPYHTAGLYASYELDLWGKLKSSQQAALASRDATKFDLQTAAMTLSAELTQTYFQWLAQKEALVVYTSQLTSNRNKLTALERRYHTGQATSLALLQQRQQVAAAEAKLPPVYALIETSEHNIAILIGKIPGTDLNLKPTTLPELPPQPSTGLPAALLENRPDIQSARLQIETADWNISEAKAARLPAITLTGSISTGGEDIERLFDDWVSNLAAGIIAPLIDGGARKAEVDRVTAVSREKIASYRLTILQAIQETEDALSNEKHQTDYLTALDKQYTAAQKSETESIHRYQRGILPYLDTLTAIVARESLEITHIQAKTNLLAYRIQLYRSLGGDWAFIMENEK